MDAASTIYGIYVVEDSAVLLQRLLDLLTDAGASIVGYSGRADAAIAEIAERRPDAIILDLNLEIGSGFDVLKAVAGLNGPPIAIVLTNYTTPEYRREAARLGAVYFYDKSRDIPQMIRTVQDLIEKHQQMATRGKH